MSTFTFNGSVRVGSLSKDGVTSYTPATDQVSDTPPVADAAAATRETPLSRGDDDDDGVNVHAALRAIEANLAAISKKVEGNNAMLASIMEQINNDRKELRARELGQAFGHRPGPPHAPPPFGNIYADVIGTRIVHVGTGPKHAAQLKLV